MNGSSRLVRATAPRLGWGFTLIELLVVVAIIMLLAALTLPVLTRATRQARAASCVNNVKQLSVALRNYANANHGTMPGIQGPCQPDGQPTWLFHMDPDHTTGNNDLVFKDAPTRGLLYPYYKDPLLVLCPSDRDGNGKFSYSIPQNTAFRVMDQVAVSSEAVLILEEHPAYNIAGRTEDGNTLDRREGGFGCSDRPANRHSGKTGQGFFDGHANLHRYDAGYHASEHLTEPWGYSCGWQ